MEIGFDESKGRDRWSEIKPDLVWLRRDTENESKKVVVDVKVTSTADMNKAFKEKDENIVNG